jgi:hypothetical protein
MHDLHDVARGKSTLSVRIPIAEYLAVVLDYDHSGIDSEGVQQVGDRTAWSHFTRGAVDGEGYRFS